MAILLLLVLVFLSLVSFCIAQVEFDWDSWNNVDLHEVAAFQRNTKKHMGVKSCKVLNEMNLRKQIYESKGLISFHTGDDFIRGSYDLKIPSSDQKFKLRDSHVKFALGKDLGDDEDEVLWKYRQNLDKESHYVAIQGDIETDEEGYVQGPAKIKLALQVPVAETKFDDRESAKFFIEVMIWNGYNNGDCTRVEIKTDEGDKRATAIPTEVPTVTPTAIPTEVPTATPTAIPTEVPTSTPTAIPKLNPQSQFLCEFMNATDISSKGLTSWDSCDNVDNACNWTGVSCSDGVITDLILTLKGIAGTIPTSISALTGLTTLDLHHNSITGTLPSEMSTLTGLTVLRLRNNSITGTLPSELSGLTSLVNLPLWSNSITGTLPSELSGLTALEYIHVHDNSITGTLPTEMSTLTGLKKLYLSSNSITGTLPSELSGLAVLGQLYLSDNSITGTFPSEMSTLTGLTELELFQNSFTGTLPTEISELTALIMLNLHTNSITGTLPTEMSTLTALNFLYLNNNSILVQSQ